MKKYFYILVSLVSCFIFGQEKPITTQTASETLFSGKITVNERVVSGTIIDNQGAPFFGVTIQINNVDKSTYPDFDGKYSIVAKSTDTLIFSYPGFKTRKIKAEKKELNVNMEEDIILEIPPPCFDPKTNKRSLLTDPTAVVTKKDIEKAINSIHFNEKYTFIIGKWKEIEYHGSDGADDYTDKIENGQTLTFEKDGSLLIQKDGTTTLGSYEIFPHDEHNLKLHILSSKKEFHYLISNQVNLNYIDLTPVTSDYQFICKEGCGHVYEKMK